MRPESVLQRGEAGLAHDALEHHAAGDLDLDRRGFGEFFAASFRRSLRVSLPAVFSRWKSLGKACPSCAPFGELGAALGDELVFVTGHNYAQPSQQVSSISSGTIEMFVNTYCASNPKGEFSDAVFRLSDQFSGRNQPIKK
jgi:hypothetical protein